MFQDCSNSAAFCALNSLFRVFTDAKGMMDAISSTGSRTRGYLPSASRLSDAYFLVIQEDFVKLAAMGNRLEDGKLNSRGLLSPWNMKRHSYKAVWKTGN